MAVHAACTEGRTGLWGDGTRRGDTWNMPYMFVTLDVSRLSGWLNADAAANMLDMVVTLDVSRLSGWLNADAEENM